MDEKAVMRDPELQQAVEFFLFRANMRKSCPICAKQQRKHTVGCPIGALNTLLNSRSAHSASTEST